MLYYEYRVTYQEATHLCCFSQTILQVCLLDNAYNKMRSHSAPPITPKISTAANADYINRLVCNPNFLPIDYFRLRCFTSEVFSKKLGFVEDLKATTPKKMPSILPNTICRSVMENLRTVLGFTSVTIWSEFVFLFAYKNIIMLPVLPVFSAFKIDFSCQILPHEKNSQILLYSKISFREESNISCLQISKAISFQQPLRSKRHIFGKIRNAVLFS